MTTPTPEPENNEQVEPDNWYPSEPNDATKAAKKKTAAAGEVHPDGNWFPTDEPKAAE